MDDLLILVLAIVGVPLFAGAMMFATYVSLEAADALGEWLRRRLR